MESSSLYLILPTHFLGVIYKNVTQITPKSSFNYLCWSLLVSNKSEFFAPCIYSGGDYKIKRKETGERKKKLDVIVSLCLPFEYF